LVPFLSALFGLRGFHDLLVLRHFLAFEGGLGPVFRWVFDRTFAQDGVAVFEAWMRSRVSRRLGLVCSVFL
jgi:hypothetical protein